MTRPSTEATTRSKLEACNPMTDALSPTHRSQHSIQWPTDSEIEKISADLAQIRRVGIDLEASGDYFKSGDLAYRIQEIIRATAELTKKVERTKE